MSDEHEPPSSSDSVAEEQSSPAGSDSVAEEQSSPAGSDSVAEEKSSADSSDSPDELLHASDPTALNRRNIIVVVAMVIALAVGGGGYLLWASNRADNELADREARAQAAVEAFEESQPRETAQPTATAVEEIEPATPTGPVPEPGEVVVVNRVPGDDYGRLAIRHADGSRTLLERKCMRVHLAGDRGVCLSQDDSIVPSFTTTFFDSTNFASEIKSYPSALPSRVRVSPAGTYSSVTAFVTGSSYEDISGESTTIVTIDDIDGNSRLRGANQFDVLGDDDRYDNLDAQFWGMSFVDDDEIYLTGFFGEFPEIMVGSLEDMTLTPTGWEGSCPSVSPDGKTVVYKEIRPEGGFDLVAVDRESDRRWVLGEDRSPDDQVEWLDNDTILYGLHPDGEENPVQPEFDIWMLDIAEGSEPELFLPNADSPATVRQG